MSIFYCPSCDVLTDEIKEREHRVVWANCRDGYGRAIKHIICPYCGYELAGHMPFENKQEDGEYVKCTISMYSDRDFIDVDKIIEGIRKDLATQTEGRRSKYDR